MAVQADWREKDLYSVLGVAEDADDQTIRRAYRKLARELHPDTHPDDPDAGEWWIRPRLPGQRSCGPAEMPPSCIWSGVR